MSKFFVGQKLWFVPSMYYHHKTPVEVVITKVGRVWLQTSNHRINAITLEADGGKYSSPGKCYLSKEEYDAVNLKEVLWKSIKTDIAYMSVPDSVTIENMEAARKLLGL